MSQTSIEQLATEIKTSKATHFVIQGQNGDSRDIERYLAAAEVLGWQATAGIFGGVVRYPYVAIWRQQ